MDYNVADWLKERNYKVDSTESGLQVTDSGGNAYMLDGTAFTKNDSGAYTGDSSAIRKAMNSAGVGAPQGYVPLRNTLAAAGAAVGYDSTTDAPVVNGQSLSTNDNRLVKVGEDYWIERGFAEELSPKDYKNPYGSRINSVLSTLINSRFQYNPQSDASLEAAQNQAMLASKQAANSRGLLGGSTAEIMRQRAAQELVPQYEQLAYNRFLNQNKQAGETLGILGQLADSAFSEYRDNMDRRIQNQELAQTAQKAQDEKAYKQDALNLQRAQAVQGEAEREFRRQLDRTLALGEVDEAAAAVLGLAPGTLTYENKKFLEEYRRTLALQEAKNQQAKDMENLSHENTLEEIEKKADEHIRTAFAEQYL